MIKSLIPTLIVLSLLSLDSLPLAGGTDTDIESRTRGFLDAYARGDLESVLQMIDQKTVTIYGSDAAEIFHGKQGMETMLSNDKKLWGNSARIGPMQHVSQVETRDQASIFFDAPFTMGDRAPILVRFAMVWQRSGNRWLLVQSSNGVPTTGQSAEQLLRPPLAKHK